MLYIIGLRSQLDSLVVLIMFAEQEHGPNKGPEAILNQVSDHSNGFAGKVVRLRQKLSDVTGAVTGLFGRKAEKDPAVARLDALKV